MIIFFHIPPQFYLQFFYRQYEHIIQFDIINIINRVIYGIMIHCPWYEFMIFFCYLFVIQILSKQWMIILYGRFMCDNGIQDNIFDVHILVLLYDLLYIVFDIIYNMLICDKICIGLYEIFTAFYHMIDMIFAAIILIYILYGLCHHSVIICHRTPKCICSKYVQIIMNL